MTDDATLVGVVVDPTALKAKIPKPIELNKLIVDDFRGDGGKSQILDARKSASYEPPAPKFAPTLGDAFKQFEPEAVVEVPSTENPGEKKKYRIPHRDMSDFEPSRYESRIPELRKLEESFQGLCSLQDWLNTQEGETEFEQVLADEKLFTEATEARGKYDAYLKRIERVLEIES